MLTEERVDAIFKEMNTYVLELANDPSSLGPQYFQNIIAVCRGHLNRVSLVASELNRERLEVSGELRRLEALYALEYDALLASSERVRALSSIEDRKATAGYLLRDQQVKINELKDRLHAAEAVYKVVTHRSRELHATMTAIKDQRRLMQTELATGAFYGDERVPKAEDDLNEEELANLLNDSTEEMTESPEEENPIVEQEAVPIEIPQSVVEGDQSATEATDIQRILDEL